MNTPTMPTLVEDLARGETTCRGCLGPKDTGPIVCWACFNTGPTPFKYTTLSFSAWVEEMYVLREEAKRILKQMAQQEIFDVLKRIDEYFQNGNVISPDCLMTDDKTLGQAVSQVVAKLQRRAA